MDKSIIQLPAGKKFTGYLSLFFDFVDILFTLFLSYTFFRLWINPGIEDAATIYSLAVLMAFEFIMVHSGVFMAVMPLRWSVFIFFPVYGLFALAFNTMIPDNTIIWLYLLVVLNRMRFSFVQVNKEVRIRQLGNSALAAMLYFILVIIVSFASGIIPDFGLTTDYLDASGYHNIKLNGGLFLDVPKVALCFGALYYFLLAVFDILVIIFGYQNQQIKKQ